MNLEVEASKMSFESSDDQYASPLELQRDAEQQNAVNGNEGAVTEPRSAEAVLEGANFSYSERNLIPKVSWRHQIVLVFVCFFHFHVLTFCLLV